MTDDLKWARELVDEHAWVFVPGAHVVGRVLELYDTDGQKYVSPINAEEVAHPVLVVEPGHSFLAVANNFIRLDERQARAYYAFQQAIKMTVEESGKLAAAHKMPPRTSALLIGAALRAQAALLEADPKQETPHERPDTPDPGADPAT